MATMAENTQKDAIYDEMIYAAIPFLVYHIYIYIYIYILNKKKETSDL